MTEMVSIDRNALISELGLTVESKFVPWSQSRNKGEKSPSLNWVVTLKRDGREILTTDYMAGSGHCPAYKASVRDMGGRNSIMRDGAIRYECEHGFAARTFDNANSPNGYTVRHLVEKGKPLEPATLDVLASLLMDSDAIEYQFTDWCDNYGYDFDSDSRKAEGIYKQCLEHAIALRSSIGEDGLRRLREAFQDY